MHVSAAELPANQQSYFTTEAQSAPSSEYFDKKVFLSVLRAFAVNLILFLENLRNSRNR